MRLTATEAIALSLDDKRARPYRCTCGRTVTGYCSVTTDPTKCPFGLQPLSRVVMAQPDTEQCE